ncbi:MAG TPA: hypothetical protein P5218_08845, partial [Planctomycetota bacterium]|nr:hypothetical protein [Planctomycetota bacterium]
DARFPGDDNLLGDWALALDQAGRWGSSVAVRERLVAKHPGEDALERAWIQALIRSGDPRGEAARASWLLRHADDEELRQLSQTGPQLVPVPSYTPMEGRHGPHDEGETPH